MLRWKLKKSVPFEADETHSSLTCARRRASRAWMLSPALARLRIIREYESLVEGTGLYPGIVLSSLACRHLPA